jgi:carbamoyltransferase
MKVLGISGTGAAASVALGIDGDIVAAAKEESFLHGPYSGRSQASALPDHAVGACLQRAGLSASDIDIIGLVSDSADLPSSSLQGLGSPVVTVEPVRAHAAQVAASAENDEALVIVLAPQSSPSGGVFVKRGPVLTEQHTILGVGELAAAAHRLAAALGCDTLNPFHALDRMSGTGSRGFESPLRAAMSFDRVGGIVSGITVSDDALRMVLARASAGLPTALSDAQSANVLVQQRRRDLAESFQSSLADLTCEIVAALLDSTTSKSLGVGGDLFATRAVVDRLHSAFGGAVLVAPVPDASGLAVGAALSEDCWQAARRFNGVALGPQFSDGAIKETLDNCRLDYVYEPNWDRLLSRISMLLSKGKAVAWFQGPMEISRQPLGRRSVLGDPSNRYARENFNRFLKRRPVEYPLSISMTDGSADECVEGPIRSPYATVRAQVKEPWRDRLQAALDSHAMARVHTVARHQAPELWDLLQAHRQRTGIPALINTSLRVGDESTALSPRDAVRATFSSAIDALVLGRFLLTKDHWLLRSHDAS